MLDVEGHESSVLSVVYSPNDMQIVSGSSDSTILIWNAETRNIYRVIKEHSDTVSSLAFSPDGKRFLSGFGMLNLVNPFAIPLLDIRELFGLLDTFLMEIDLHPDLWMGLFEFGRSPKRM